MINLPKMIRFSMKAFIQKMISSQHIIKPELDQVLFSITLVQNISIDI